MVEYYTEAVVLDKEDLGDFDSRIFLYCEDLGKIAAKATSARKIVSKLASHLEPGNLIKVRLVQSVSWRNQVVDALKVSSLPKNQSVLRILNLVKELSAEGQPDPELWHLLKSGDLAGEKILEALGFGGEFAVCQKCGVEDPAHFLLNELEYYCAACFVKAVFSNR